MKTVDIRQMCRDLAERIDGYRGEIEKIGYVCKENTPGKKLAVWAKVGYKQRIEELEKTRLAIMAIEAQILNDGLYDLPESTKRIKRSASHIYGKGTSLQFDGKALEMYMDNLPF